MNDTEIIAQLSQQVQALLSISDDLVAQIKVRDDIIRELKAAINAKDKRHDRMVRIIKGEA